MSHHNEYTSARSDRVFMTEHEVKEAISQNSEFKAQLRALLRLEKAAAEVEEGELVDLKYIYIQDPSQVFESNSEIIGSSKSKISVYKDPVGPSSLKRKANDQGDVLKAKKQQKASFQKGPSVGPQREQEDGLALIDGGPAVNGGDPPEWTTPDVGRLEAPKERNIRKPTSRFRNGPKQLNVSYEESILKDERPSNGTVTILREGANNASKNKPVNIARDSGTDVETPKPARSSVQPSMGSPVVPKPPVGAESAFNKMSKRNKEALKDQKMQDAINRKLQPKKEKGNRTDKNGSRASRQAAPKPRSTALSKKRESCKTLAQPKDENTPDWQRSFSTAPPKTTASKPMIAQVHKGTKEVMVLEKIGSTDRKRKAEEGLAGSTAKILKENMGPFSNSRAVTPAQSLTDYEAIFGKGSKPRRLDIQRVCVARGNRPDQKRRLFATSEQSEDV